MADLNQRPIGMLGTPTYFYNDNIPSNYGAKSRILEEMQRRANNRPTLSQYTPKEGEQQIFYNDKIARMVEENMPLNKLASSKGAENLFDAINFATDVMGTAEGIGALKGLLKKAPKFELTKAATTVAEDKAKGNAVENAASTIFNKNTGLTQYFDKNGNEIATNKLRTAEEVRLYNQALKNQFRTGSTGNTPEGLNPYLTQY